MIFVLGILSLIAALAASTVSMSQLVSAQVAAAVGQEKAVYVAESAATRAQWLLLDDINRYPDRALEDSAAPDRFRADGLRHNLELAEGAATVTLTDLCSGLSLDGAGAGGLAGMEPLYVLDPVRRRDYTALLDRYQDYRDEDDLVRANGMEAADYRRLGLAPLPRNRPLQYREELLWIPGAAAFFPADEDTGRLTSIRLITPGRVMTQLSRLKPAFATAPADLLMSKLGMDRERVDAVLDARNRFQTQGVPLSANLPPDLIARLHREFLFQESGFYTLVVTARTEPGRPPRTLVLSLRAERNPASGFIRYYEWQWL